MPQQPSTPYGVASISLTEQKTEVEKAKNLGNGTGLVGYGSKELPSFGIGSKAAQGPHPAPPQIPVVPVAAEGEQED